MRVLQLGLAYLFVWIGESPFCCHSERVGEFVPPHPLCIMLPSEWKYMNTSGQIRCSPHHYMFVMYVYSYRVIFYSIWKDTGGSLLQIFGSLEGSNITVYTPLVYSFISYQKVRFFQYFESFLSSEAFLTFVWQNSCFNLHIKSRDASIQWAEEAR